MIKLAIAVPFGGRRVAPEWAVALANLQVPMNCTYARLTVKGQPRDVARATLVDTARQMGAQYVLFLDDDTAPPSETIVRLVALLDNRPDVAAAGGIYVSRGGAVAEPVVFQAEGAGPYWDWRVGEIFRCWGIGTGCLMIRLSVFDTLPRPWFRNVDHLDEAAGLPQHAGTIGYTMTEDLFFCRRVAEAGGAILAHGGILPIHYGEDGVPHVLDPESAPLRGTDAGRLWYAPLVQERPATAAAAR